MRKWTDRRQPTAPPMEGEGGPEENAVRRARAFRRWMARGAEPGGLRSLADERELEDGPAAEQLASVRAIVGARGPHGSGDAPRP